MQTITFAFLAILVATSGCLSQEQYLQQKLEGKLVETIGQYNTGQEILNEYDVSCMDRMCMNECVSNSSIPDQESRNINCKFECGDIDRLEERANKYPQCRKGAVVEDCSAVYKCKNPIIENGLHKCSEEELAEHRRRCGW